MNLTYTKEVLKHLRSPKNMGEIKNADGVGTVGNHVCGDIMKIYIKVDKKNNGEEILKDIKFQTLGCGAAIATSSALTTLVKGKTLEDALKIDKNMIIKALGGLPQSKIHCSVLADEALKKAIKNYQEK
jgi:nitrogen fixation protein NifU and related proteins